MSLLHVFNLILNMESFLPRPAHGHVRFVNRHLAHEKNEFSRLNEHKRLLI